MINLGTAKILVTGVSGPIGSTLVPVLKEAGAQVTRLVRSRTASDQQTIFWDPAQPLSPDAVSSFDAVIHLAGETIVGRWTAAKKTKIRDSRVLGTRNLAEAIAQAKSKPRVFISSSAIGYYGDRGDEVLDEQSTAGSGFLAEVCRDWEAATQPAAHAGIRTIQIRTGVVLTASGGALGKMLTPFKLGVGGKIGSGRQWMSWIDIQDMVGAILHILGTDSLQGAVNLVGPNPVTNAEFTKTLGHVLSRPTIFPMPRFAAKLAFGEMGETVLLGSQKVAPTRLAGSGYIFQFSNLRGSLEHLLK